MSPRLTKETARLLLYVFYSLHILHTRIKKILPHVIPTIGMFIQDCRHFCPIHVKRHVSRVHACIQMAFAYTYANTPY